jgi:hypothetical protein
MAMRGPNRTLRWTLAGLVLVLVLGGFVYLRFGAGARETSERAASDASASDQPIRYAVEYPTIGYATTTPTDSVARLGAALATGQRRLRFEAPRGYLDTLLRALDIDPASQMLVFSQTSLQARRISPKTPRAIYFNDDTYVAWVPGAEALEIAALDPKLGFDFYTVDQTERTAPSFDRQMRRCLRCHDTYSLTGGGVPRLLVGSGYVDTRGKLVSHEGWILTNDETPLKSRWGGWYVTGHSPGQAHLGNIVVGKPDDLQNLDALRVEDIDSLDGLFDTGPYLTDQSDIVALMVLEHQMHVQNLIIRVNYDTRTALHNEKQIKAELGRDENALSADTLARVATIAEPLVQAMFLVDEAELAGPITGTSGFAQKFQARGPRDEQGRTLRELDLRTRLFRYPLSYVVYSAAFDALPDVTKRYVYRRFDEILSGKDDSGKFAKLSAADRRAIREILTATKPAFTAALGDLRSVP